MSWVDALGWFGSALLIYSLLQARILRLRVLNTVACVILIVFNALIGVWPMVAMNVVLAAINPVDSGLSDYSGPLLSDLDFAAFSHSALVRIADEVCLQMHLLNLGFLRAVRARSDAETARTIAGWARCRAGSRPWTNVSS